MSLPQNIIAEVITFCNRDLVPDENFDAQVQFHSEWFRQYFCFLGNENLEKHLGDAFYQARFIYKLMNALKLPALKNRGIVKFQIIQYASICEAILDASIEKYFKEDAEKSLSKIEYKKIDGVLSSKTKILFDSKEVAICQRKVNKGVLKRTRIDEKTQYAVNKGIISQDIKESFDKLYDLRNNVHILKASQNQYMPRIIDAKDAFIFMGRFIQEVKNFYIANS